MWPISPAKPCALGLDLAVDADGARDAGAERDEEEAVGAAPGADAALGETAGAHVVAERHGDAAEPLGEQGAQGHVTPAEVGGVGGDTLRLVDDAGHGDAGRRGRFAVLADAMGAELRREAEDALDHGVRAALAAGGTAGLVQQLAARPDQGGLHPGAAHVEGDDMFHGEQCGPWTHKRSSPLTWCRP